MITNPWRSSSIRSALSGRSSIDAKRIHIHSPEEAREFISSYGYDLNDPLDKAEISELVDEAIGLIAEELLIGDEAIPQALLDNRDIIFYLLNASNPRLRDKALWSGSILRVAHTLAHSQSYLNDRYHDAIREQILTRFGQHIQSKKNGVYLGRLKLMDFKLRSEKSRRSVAMKLMHKTENVSADIFDWIGLRFVTQLRADALDVIAYLRNHHLITFANLKPSRSRNTLIDLDWVDQQLAAGIPLDKIKKQLQMAPYPVQEKVLSGNRFSSMSYHSIQFTCRQRIKIRNGNSENFNFFFPFEIQILDNDSYIKSLEGLSSHKEYKSRQKMAVRKRVLPFLVANNS